MRVNVSNSNEMSEYSSSEMESSDNAFEMRLLIVLSAETAKIASFLVFLFSTTSFYLLDIHNIKSKAKIK